MFAIRINIALAEDNCMINRSLLSDFQTWMQIQNRPLNPARLISPEFCRKHRPFPEDIACYCERVARNELLSRPNLLGLLTLSHSAICLTFENLAP